MKNYALNVTNFNLYYSSLKDIEKKRNNALIQWMKANEKNKPSYFAIMQHVDKKYYQAKRYLSHNYYNILKDMEKKRRNALIQWTQANEQNKPFYFVIMQHAKKEYNQAKKNLSFNFALQNQAILRRIKYILKQNHANLSPHKVTKLKSFLKNERLTLQSLKQQILSHSDFETHNFNKLVNMAIQFSIK